MYYIFYYEEEIFIYGEYFWVLEIIRFIYRNVVLVYFLGNIEVVNFNWDLEKERVFVVCLGYYVSSFSIWGIWFGISYGIGDNSGGKKCYGSVLGKI